MIILRPFKNRMLESLLIVVSVAASVAAATVVTNLLAFSERVEGEILESRDARQIVLKSTVDDFDAFYLSAITADIYEVGSKERAPPKLAFEDLAAVKAAAPTVTHAYIEDYWAFGNEVLASSDSLYVSKVTAEFQEAAGLQVSQGSLINAPDFNEHNRVMLISRLGIKKLKLKEPIIGQMVDFEDDGTYTIIGVLEQLENLWDGINFYEAVVPWEPSEWREISQLNLSVTENSDVRQAQSEIRTYADETWSGTMVVRSSVESYLVYFEQLRVRALISAVIASLVLVTASLGIMSLMLRRVLRRQREIGVRRSIGATQSAIRSQFLSEALMLGTLGGLFGVAAGYGLYAPYRRYLESIYERYSDSLTFSTTAAFGAFGAALTLTLLFGLYPAIVASKVIIIDALKET